MKKILIIEDDLDTLDMLGYLMQDIHYDVVKFDQLIPIADAVALKPDIVLVDYWLPNGHGTDFCLAIKTHPELRFVTVILISTHRQLKSLAEESWADAYIEKPFSIDDVTNLIKRF